MNTTHLAQQITTLFFVASFSLCMMPIMELVSEIGILFKWRRREHMIFDFIQILLCSLVFLILLIIKYSGLVRSYVFLGLILGIGLYYTLLKRYCSPICQKSAKMLFYIGGKILALWCFPWKIVKNFIIKPVYMRCKVVIQRYKQAFYKSEVQDESLEEII